MGHRMGRLAQDLVRVVVAVVVMCVGAYGFQIGWGAAAVSGFAACDFELDGGVGDVEAVAEGAVDSG